jgi:hydrogenase-4 component B
MTAQALLVLSVALPLSLVLAIPLTTRPLRLLPWAALPGLAASLLAPSGTMVEFPMLLLGLSIAVDRLGAVFLGFGSLLWLLGGLSARAYLAGGERAASFALFWLLTLAGTLGTFVAADVVTFYAAFSAMSLAAYGLVVFDRTASARRAGRIYIVLAIAGEATLLAAFMLAATAAETPAFADIRAAIAASPWSGAIVAGLIGGFGIKAGLVPLHVWLPLAHPAAPTPASAVLSGVIVKAGIVGLMRFLPMEAAWPMASDALVVLGLVTAYSGVIVGLLQSDVKAILAYSTLSQMGLVATVLGAGLGQPEPARTLDVAALYASQHGLAKAALFLAVGIVAASGPRVLRPAMAITAAMALAIAGLPLTGGALAKLAIKGPLGEGPAELLVSVSAAGTAMLMLRFLWLLMQTAKEEKEARPASGLLIAWAGTVLAAVVVPWMLFPELAKQPLAYAFAAGNLWAGLWPILLAASAAFVVLRLRLRLAPALSVPPGDIVVAGEAAVRGIRALHAQMPSGWSGAAPRLGRLAGIADHLSGCERALQRWTLSGAAMVAVVLAIALMLAR